MPGDEVVIGAGWDETDWPDRDHPTADDLERVAPGRRLYLSRVDGHSAIVSHALLAETPQARAQDGWSDDGRLQRRAKHTVSDRLSDLVGPEQRLDAARQAVAALAARGIGAFHENAAPHIGPDYEVDLVRQRRRRGRAARHALLGRARRLRPGRPSSACPASPGDLVADGAVGSRTASMRGEYADQAGHCGHGYLDATQIAEHVVGCTRLGVQAGFHCIGDAALDAVAEGFDAGRPAARRRRRCARAGTGSSTARCPRSRPWRSSPGSASSPASSRCSTACGAAPTGCTPSGWASAGASMNPFRDLHLAGVPLAFGSDSPVTPADPWRAVQAAVHHHTDGPAARPRRRVPRPHPRRLVAPPASTAGLLRLGAAGDVRRVGHARRPRRRRTARPHARHHPAHLRADRRRRPHRPPHRGLSMTGKLGLDPADFRRARALARTVGRPIVSLAKKHTTVSVERATLRLAGLQGADADGIPWVNRLTDVVRADLHDQGGLAHGVALPVWDALRRGEADDLRHPGPEGLGRERALPAAGGSRREGGRPPPPAPPSARASSASTPAAWSASG